ncbi:unnamed protein product [Rotaria sp. Silwood1]|nr:unnamed protein product [Rotaria sp. Silwood1]CAF3728658.1 unnamed protein product [Rotaria sp. Silwood1]CAF3774999.1 unnamed protein product [Rotaria sp. Silwood1]CAF3869224.1 unnamed protein product [Rotaria sp. Silwood1]CAF4682728.1 unnamed protein product [Rotaria sp. Silwood1]
MTEHQTAVSRAQWNAVEARQHLMELFSEILNPKGRSYSIEANKIALLFILDLMVEGMNKTESCKHVAKRLHRDHQVLYQLINHFFEYREMIDIDSANRGHGSTTYVLILSSIYGTYFVDCYTLHRLGYQLGRDHIIIGNPLQNKTSCIRQFSIDYANALKAEEHGNSVIVYMDESYVNTRHALNGT